MYKGLHHGIGEDNNNFIHGKTGSKCYTSWLGIKKRCFDTNSQTYQEYGAHGITMGEEFINSFITFLNEVGEPPTQDKFWSIDRIDNGLGYIKGNMKWSTPAKQARNRTKRIDNTSGVTSVYFEYSGNHNHATYACAVWKGLDGNRHKKTFNTSKLGLLEAFAKAVEYRNSVIIELNKQGADYSVNHGK